jgi:membrane protein YdbS with pleckstrin-like domain
MPVFEKNPNATCVKYPLSPRYVTQQVIGSIILLPLAFLAVIVVAFFIASVDSSPINLSWILSWNNLFIAIILILLCIPVIYWYSKLYCKEYYYDFAEDSVIIRKGVWLKNQVSFNYRRIQDVYVHQFPLQVLLGLYTVTIATAASQTAAYGQQMSDRGMASQYAYMANPSISGLDEETATKVKELLLEKIKKSQKK